MVTRRRFIHLTAAAGGLPLLPVRCGSATATSAGAYPQLRIWRGVALGADAMLQIHHPDPATAERLIERCRIEVARLERIFSLYRQDSALRRLNRDGRLDDPPVELVDLLGRAQAFSRLTAGAFDATVQPLWDLYAAHFSAPHPDPSGPSSAVIGSTLSRVGHDAVEVDAARIRLTKPGMAVTLNGIAQGYITDLIVELLRRADVDRSLVDMGEIRAIGPRPSGSPWIVGLEDPAMPGRVAERIEIVDRAVSTSGGYGTLFDPQGRFNHIFDPRTGATSWRYLSVSVIAATATTADALSTGFSLMPLDAIRPVVASLGIKAHLVLPNRSRIAVGI